MKWSRRNRPKEKPSDPRPFGKLWPFLRYAFLAFIAGQVVLASLGAAAFVGGISPMDLYASQDGASLFLAFDVVLLINAAVTAICAVAYLRFHYRALRNVRAIGAVGVRVTPFWTVGRYALPVVALWTPLIALRQTWRGSFAPKTGDARVPAYIGWWWGLWILINFAIGIQAKLQEFAVGVELALLSMALSIANAPILIASAGAVLRFSGEIRRAQNENVLGRAQ